MQNDGAVHLISSLVEGATGNWCTFHWESETIARLENEQEICEQFKRRIG
jgi:hypothetical protein